MMATACIHCSVKKVINHTLLQTAINLLDGLLSSNYTIDGAYSQTPSANLQKQISPPNLNKTNYPALQTTILLQLQQHF